VLPKGPGLSKLNSRLDDVLVYLVIHQIIDHRMPLSYDRVGSLERR